ncbi:hypothetical protein CP979_34475 [Streptomyces filamentosus]|nr:hypothetical protein CP979_34475 [Streptomyces filamentosus]
MTDSAYSVGSRQSTQRAYGPSVAFGGRGAGSGAQNAPDSVVMTPRLLRCGAGPPALIPGGRRPGGTRSP